MKTVPRFSILPLAIAVWAGVSLACASITPKNEPPGNEPPGNNTEIPHSQTPAYPTSKLGEVVENLGYSLVATKIEDRPSPNSYNAPKPGYKRLAVEITVSNVSGAEPLDIYSFHVYLVDSDGFVYEADHAFGDDDLAMVTLSVGEKAKGWVYFIIPESVTPAYIKYKIDSDNFLVAGLGK